MGTSERAGVQKSMEKEKGIGRAAPATTDEVRRLRLAG
jgi:hypothetical protein